MVLLCDARLIPIKSRRCDWSLDQRNPRSTQRRDEKIETEQTKAVPELLKNKHFPVNPES
jgi:hypothetical protein